MHYLLNLVFRLEEKVSDMEQEDKILRQQALFNSASRKMSPQVSFTRPPVKFLYATSHILYLVFFFQKSLDLFLFTYLLQPVENGHHVSEKLDELFLFTLNHLRKFLLLEICNRNIFLKGIICSYTIKKVRDNVF